MTFKDRFDNWLRRRGAKPPEPRSSPPRHFGDIWEALQEIAREESPEKFQLKPVSEHAAESLEGKKDVERWLEIYRCRSEAGYAYHFPGHYLRHRGFCLIPRRWPSGIVWEAFDETTLFKAPLDPQPTQESLIQALDRRLGKEAAAERQGP